MVQLQDHYDAIWHRTCQQSDFDPVKLAAALDRNERACYGLTLILGHPLPQALTERIESLKQAYREIARGRIRFGKSVACHLTVYGLKRSQEAPFSRQEIEPLLRPLADVLQDELGAVSSLSVSLSGSVVSEDGAILACGGESETLGRLRTAIGRIEGVDPPKSPSIHVSIGHFCQPSGSPKAHRRALEAMERLRRWPLGTLVAREVKLVYYRNRLLDEPVRQARIQLPVAEGKLELADLFPQSRLDRQHGLWYT